MTADSLLESLARWLSSECPGATASVRDRETLEVRLPTTDSFSTQFPVHPGRVSVRTHTTLAPTFKKASRSKRDAKEQAPDITEADRSALAALVDGRYPFLTKTSPATKTWDSVILDVSRLAYGTFHASHTWDRKWSTRAVNGGYSPQVVQERFPDIPSVISAMAKCLDYVKSYREAGSFWWPSRTSSKSPKSTLAQFLCSRMKNGCCWSPFCEILAEADSYSASRDMFPEAVLEIADKTIAASPFIRGLSQRAMSRYWAGIRKFVSWYRGNREALLSAAVPNRVRLSSVVSAMELVKSWNEACGGRSLPYTYVYPGVESWPRFVRWCRDQHGIVIPDVG